MKPYHRITAALGVGLPILYGGVLAQNQNPSPRAAATNPAVAITINDRGITADTGAVRLDEFMKSFAEAAGGKTRWQVAQELKKEIVFFGNIKNMPLADFKSRLAKAVNAEFKTGQNGVIQLMRTPEIKQQLALKANAENIQTLQKPLEENLKISHSLAKLKAELSKQWQEHQAKDANRISQMQMTAWLQGPEAQFSTKLLQAIGLDQIVKSALMGRPTYFATYPNSVEVAIPMNAKVMGLIQEHDQICEDIENWNPELVKMIRADQPDWARKFSDFDKLSLRCLASRAASGIVEYSFQLMGLKQGAPRPVEIGLTSLCKSEFAPIQSLSQDLVQFDPAGADGSLRNIIAKIKSQPQDLKLQDPALTPQERDALIRCPLQLVEFIWKQACKKVFSDAPVIACLPDSAIDAANQLLTHPGKLKFDDIVTIMQRQGRCQVTRDGDAVVIQPVYPLEATASRQDMAAWQEVLRTYHEKQTLPMDDMARFVSRQPRGVLGDITTWTLAAFTGCPLYDRKENEAFLRIWDNLSAAQKTDAAKGLVSISTNNAALRPHIREFLYHSPFEIKQTGRGDSGNSVILGTQTFDAPLPATIEIKLASKSPNTVLRLCDGDRPLHAVNAVRSYYDVASEQLGFAPSTLPPSVQNKKWQIHESIRNRFTVIVRMDTATSFYDTSFRTTAPQGKPVLYKYLPEKVLAALKDIEPQIRQQNQTRQGSPPPTAPQ